MRGNLTRRRFAAGVGALSLVGTPSPVSASTETTTTASCSATVETNAETSDGDPKLEVRPETTEISGTSACDPGSEITVQVVNDDSENPFLDEPEATVGEDGSFSVSVDFSILDPGASFEVTVIRYDGTENQESISPTYAGEVVEDLPTTTEPTTTTSSTPTSAIGPGFGVPAAVLGAGYAVRSVVRSDD